MWAPTAILLPPDALGTFPEMTGTQEADFGRGWGYRYSRPSGEQITTWKFASDDEAIDHGRRFVVPEHGGPIVIERLNPSGTVSHVFDLS